MTNKELIAHIQNAKTIHQNWADYQQKRKDNKQRLITRVGDVAWHEKWAKIYEDVIEALSK
jgi:hypothetical protein